MQARSRAQESEPSRAAEDYLKAIYKLQGSTRSVSTSDLAGEMERSAASVTNMVKSLAKRGLLEHEPYYGVRLTSQGEESALRIIRRHRVIESFLIEKLGYTWDGVHREAERLEHAASEELIDRMAAAMGEPSHDPHGAPIPSPEGELTRRPVTRLAEVPPDRPAIVREVSDDSAERLRRLGALGLFPGTRVVVAEEAREPDGIMTIRVGGEEHRLGRQLAGSVAVELTRPVR